MGALRRLLLGAAAGAAGTLLMTAWMTRIAPRLLPRKALPAEFPPRRVVEWAEAEAGRPHALGRRETDRVTMAAHYGYGMAWGAAYALLRPIAPVGPSWLAGAAFGVGIWALSYQGWLPAAGVQRPTTEHRAAEWPYITVAHAIYGAATAAAFSALAPAAGRRRRTGRSGAGHVTSGRGRPAAPVSASSPAAPAR